MPETNIVTMRRIGAAWESLRTRQWVKNVVVLAPVFFSGKLVDQQSLASAILSMVCFCVASSGAYLLNDLLDRRLDRFQPTKKHRPITSGKLPVTWAVGLISVLVVGSFVLSITVHPRLATILVGYWLLNILYSVLLKRFVILDVLALSGGFVLRVWAGAVVLDLVPSHWLQLSMFFLALFLSLAKRRQELVILHARALRHRGVLSDYSPAFIDQLTSILTAVSILCYALYSVSSEVTNRVGQFGFIATVPFVVYGVFRYLYLVHVRREALDPTEAILSDRSLMVSVVLWIACILLILYR